MGEPLDATGVWAAELRALWEAAGKPTGAAITRQAAGQKPPLKVTSSSWSDWLGGENVPADPVIAAWLVTFLRGRARQRTPAFVTEPDAWWQQVWRQAREERQGRGGRPSGARSARPPVVWEQVRVGVVPRAADCFQDRAVAGRLERAAEQDGTVVLTQRDGRELTQVLAGMGGVGKTQLAAAYARHAWQQGVGVLVWVNAATRDGVVSAYADTAVRLGLPLADRKDPDRSAREFLAWAETTTQCWWLVVLDDVRSLGDLRGLWPAAAASAAGGQVVVTTRLRDAALEGAGRRMVTVDTFTAGEARGYLRAKLGSRAADAGEVEALAGELGHLPLALAQAAAYILGADITIAAYRERLATRLLRRAVPSGDELPDDHERIVAATWELSIDQADRAEPVGLARPVLQLAGVLDPAGIPQTALCSPPALDYLTGYLTGPPPDRLPARPAHAAQRDSQVSGEMVDEVLRVLHRHSLIDHDRTAAHREVRVHQLVQRATREALATHPDRGPELFIALAGVAADALLAVWPQVERDEFGQILRANTTALTRAAQTALWHPDTGGHGVLFKAATSLGETGQATAARDAYAALHATALHHLGPDHPDTLASRGNLAFWRGEAGDAAGAATATQELLADRMRVLGPDHPDTLTTRNNLAALRGRAGDAAGAAAAFEDLLADQMRVLGPDHPDTLTTRNNLALWRGRAGDAAGAAAAFQDLLTEFLRVLGPDHPHTLATRNNLAALRGRAGDAAGAAAAFEELLADRMRVLGPDHPDTLVTRGNLAFWRGEAGDAAGAAAAFQDLLADQMRVLGPDHPDTLTTRNNLALWRGRAGDAAGAAAAFQDLLTEVVRVLGPDHPDTLVTRSNLASWRGEAGDAAGAAAAFQELLTEFLRVLGPDHPHTLATRSNLASWRGEAGDAAGAAAAFQELLTEFLRVLGPDHPHTLATRSNLASWRGRAGDAAGAAAAFEELLADRMRVLGPDHPDTLVTRSNLALWRGEAGDAAGAATATQDLLADQMRVLGPDHPDTLTTRSNLASWRGEAGDAAGTAAAFQDLLADQMRVLGPDHPDTLLTRSNLASWRGEAGDAAGAAAAFQELLTEFLRVLGPDHPHTLATCGNLAYWRERASLGLAPDPGAGVSETLDSENNPAAGPKTPESGPQ
ncbi:tetratricopeptide repeat protein [Actinomadura formosensis]|uniref:tetratricopeptide repeat protein n=1 Tax=Actinomadura formosensis TaxID=60706 RepID=UPI003D8E461F